MNGKLKRVLFVCIGNSCRSQMAEAFARARGGDVLIPASAGLRPAMCIAPDTIRAMAEKSIDLSGHFPKSLRQMRAASFDLAINMSRYELPAETASRVEDWDVPDPILLTYEEHCVVRDEIEHLVTDLILELRREQSAARYREQGGSGPGR